MSKPASITLRVSHAIKKLAMDRAKEDHRSLTSYIEWLIKCDAAKRDKLQDGGDKT